MKCLKTIVLLLFCGTVALGQHSILTEKVKAKRKAGTSFIKTNLFSKKIASVRSAVLDQYVEDYTRLSLNNNELKSLLQEGHEALEVDIPFKDQLLTLELVKADLYADGFSVRTNDAPDGHPYEQGVFYQGIIQGTEQSMASFSVFANDIIGVFDSDKYGNLVLGKFGAEERSEFVIYQESDLKIEDQFSCETAEPDWDAKKIEEIHRILSQPTASIRADKCVNIYFELDYDLYKEKGSVSKATDFISGIFNSVQTLYANDGIDVSMSEVFVWTQNDGYGTSSTTNALTSFRNKRKNFNGDVAHLVSRGSPKNGGIAWVDALCTSYAYAYSWVNGSYNNFPTYSWTVNVITHETGHVLGSPHTHNCSWPGGAIDNCYTPEPSQGSACSDGPAPSGGGTIMSYCHLTSYGINFNNGFGELPGKLIRNRVSNMGCLSSCNSSGTGPTPTCNDGIKNGNETGVDCGGDCAPCATCNDGIQNGDETGVDCGGSCAPCATCNDGVQNGNETGIDCGGDCGPCEVDNYCGSGSGNSQYEHISRVIFANIDNSSGQDGYGNYTNLVANVEKGKTYKLKITPKFAGAAYAEHYTVWIDWNGDEDFSDSGEKALATTGSTTIQANIKIPGSAKNGKTRMRIQMQWNNASNNPCGIVSYGEVEDYSLKISGNGSTGPTPTCNDGIKNGNETGVDCGGDCEPCATCNDGIQNGDETGVDCGGSCGPCDNTGSAYCESKSTTTQYEYIKNVSFADLNNSSKTEGGYSNYTDIEAHVSKGSSYTLKVTPGYNGSPYIEFIAAYIDWNGDGDFKDSGEEVLTKSGNTTVKGTVTIPNFAILGSTRMRIQMQWNKAPAGPCSIISYGEVEDYTVTIGGGGSPTCGDGVKNGSETGVDCGGGCGPCTSCNDGVKNGNETGVDCGGDCEPCATCNDGIQNGDETGVDCGGSCGPCVVNVSYCNSSSNKTTYEYIKLVKFGSINNASGNNGGYGDFTNMSTNLSKSTAYSITLEPHYAGVAYNEGWNVYIDFNQDGDFKDAGEDVFQILAKNQVKGTITIPGNAKLGSTRMRIQMQWNKNTGTSCDNFGWGEVEDYTVVIGGSGNIANNFIEEESSLAVNIFPNPVKEILVVQPQTRSTGTIFVNIYNVVGKQVGSREIRGEERFDVSALMPGYYLMEFDNGKEKITKQFIKK